MRRRHDIESVMYIRAKLDAGELEVNACAASHSTCTSSRVFGMTRVPAEGSDKPAGERLEAHRADA